MAMEDYIWTCGVSSGGNVADTLTCQEPREPWDIVNPIWKPTVKYCERFTEMIIAYKDKNVDHGIHNIMWYDRRQGTANRTDCWGHAGRKYRFLFGQFTTGASSRNLIVLERAGLEVVWVTWPDTSSGCLLFPEELRKPAGGTPSGTSKSSCFTSSSKTSRFWW